MKKILIIVIKFYQKYLSPLKQTKCPYFPTCSGYGLEAVEKHGAFKGFLLASWRVLRCNPFSKGGCDPVPDEFHLRSVFKKSNKKDNKMKYIPK